MDDLKSDDGEYDDEGTGSPTSARCDDDFINASSSPFSHPAAAAEDDVEDDDDMSFDDLDAEEEDVGEEDGVAPITVLPQESSSPKLANIRAAYLHLHKDSESLRDRFDLARFLVTRDYVSKIVDKRAAMLVQLGEAEKTLRPEERKELVSAFVLSRATFSARKQDVLREACMDASLDEEIRLSKRPTPDWSNLKSMYTAMFKNDPVCHDRFELAQYLVLNDYVNKKNPVKRAEKLVALAQEKERTAPAVREKLSKSFVECKLKFDANVKERQNADKAWQLKHPKLYKRSLARRNARRHVSISNKTPGAAAPAPSSSSSSSASVPKPVRPAAPKPVAPRAMDPPAALTASASLESMKDMVGMLAPKAQMEMNAALLNQWRELQRAISEDVDTFTRHAKELDRRVYGHFHKFLDEQLNQQQ